MAVTTKVIRVANPKRRAGRGAFRLRTARRKNAAKRRKLSPKQIRIFGTPAQKAALKRRRKAKAHTPARRRHRSNPSRRPKTRVIYRTKRAAPKRRRRRANPGLVVTLGSVNPRQKRRSNPVAKLSKAARRRAALKAARTRKKRAAQGHHRPRKTRNRKNPRVVYVTKKVRRRRIKTRMKNRYHRVNRRRTNARRRSHNPVSILGRSSPKDLLKIGGGILGGVWLTKQANNLINQSGVASSFGSSPYMSVLITGVSAWLTGFVVTKFIDPEVGGGAYAGGIAMTMLAAINAINPSFGGQFSLGDLVNGNFVVPQNPIMAGNPMSMSAPAARGMSAYGPAY